MKIIMILWSLWLFCITFRDVFLNSEHDLQKKWAKTCQEATLREMKVLLLLVTILLCAYYIIIGSMLGGVFALYAIIKVALSAIGYKGLFDAYRNRKLKITRLTLLISLVDLLFYLFAFVALFF